MMHTMDTLTKLGKATRDGDCLIWHAAKAGKGYGVVEDERERYVHRLVLLLDGRPLAPGEQSRHRCGRNDCFNPEHLIAGTQADNEQDKLVHGTYIHGSAGVGYCGKWLTSERTGPRCRRKPHDGPCDPETFERRWQEAGNDE